MGSLSPDSKAASHAAQLHLTDSDTRIYFASVNMGDKKIKLTYFDLRARGEPCRLLLAYGGVKYEDERIPPPWDPTSTWATLKPTTPFGQLPVLNWDGVEICQSMAAARFIDLHVFMYATDAVDKAVLAKFPKLANLTERVGNVPNIKAWVESRPKTDL